MHQERVTGDSLLTGARAALTACPRWPAYEGKLMVNVLLAGGISMALSLLGTPVFARFLVRRSYGQFIRDDLAHHHYKRGKPTMGGAVIIGAAVVGYFGSHLLLVAVSASGTIAVAPGRLSLSALLVLFLLVGMGLVGFLDDYTKISKARSLGLTSKQKLAGQTLVTVVFALLALLVTDGNGRASASTAISFIRDTAFDLAAAGPVLGVVLFILWANVLISGASNGVNITDGLDGLATGASVMVFGAYAGIGLWQYNQNCAWHPDPAATTCVTRSTWLWSPAPSPAPASGSCGGTPPPPASSWATPGRCPSAPPWQAWRS